MYPFRKHIKTMPTTAYRYKVLKINENLLYKHVIP